MSVDPIHPHQEIASLVHAAKHEHDDHAEFHKKKKKKKKKNHESDVEDLMDHSHEDAQQAEELVVLLPEAEDNDSEKDHLNVLL